MENAGTKTPSLVGSRGGTELRSRRSSIRATEASEIAPSKLPSSQLPSAILDRRSSDTRHVREFSSYVDPTDERREGDATIGDVTRFRCDGKRVEREEKGRRGKKRSRPKESGRKREALFRARRARGLVARFRPPRRSTVAERNRSKGRKFREITIEA